MNGYGNNNYGNNANNNNNNNNPYGNNIYEMLHYNQKKQTYKVFEIAKLGDEGILLKMREGVKGGDNKAVAISLSSGEALEIAKTLEVLVEKIVENKIK